MNKTSAQLTVLELSLLLGCLGARGTVGAPAVASEGRQLPRGEASLNVEPDLIGDWKLGGNGRDSSGKGNDLLNHGVDLTARNRAGDVNGAARFDGRDQYLEAKSNESLRFGRTDFSIAVWVHTERNVDDTLGDLVSKYDPVSRRGFQLSLLSGAGACTSTANTRNLFFGMDARTEPRWSDCGRPGNSLLPFALAVFQGNLYAGTFETGKDEAGHVYRYAGGRRWEDCGQPDRCNSVTALAVFEGKLYAAVSRYNAGGSHLRPSENLNIGGKVYRYEGGNQWSDCGRVSEAEFIFGMVVFDGKLHVSSMDAPPKKVITPEQGLYRYEGGQRWTYCGNPGGRVAALAVSDGKLYGTGYNGGELGGLFRYEGGTDWANLGAPPGVDQTYSFAFYGGEMHVGTWKYGTVYRYEGGHGWVSAGRLGQELEVMGMAVYNGKLYAGTLPLAEVYRYDGGGQWKSTGRLDLSNVEYRRAWSMAVCEGRLFCGVLPSGHVHALEAGQAVSYDEELRPGWRHVVAMREGRKLKLYVDGRLVASSRDFNGDELDLANDAPLTIGFGSHDYFNGAMSELRIYGRALKQSEVERLRGIVEPLNR